MSISDGIMRTHTSLWRRKRSRNKHIRDIEELPTFENMHNHVERCKSWEGVGALKKYLLKQVNRPWSEVYRGLIKRIHGEQARLRLDQMLGWIMENDTIRQYRCCSFFYVDASGLLKHHRGEKYVYRKPKPGITKIDGKSYAKLDGIWYELTIKNIEPTYAESNQLPIYDVIFREYVYCSHIRSYNELTRFYGGSYVCTGKRQLNSHEIKKLKLNDI